MGFLVAASLFVAGLAWWSLLEYLLHRWVFHNFPRTLGKRHLQHHARLQEKRLAMAPLASSLGGAAIHAVVFVGLFGVAHGLPLLAGMSTGYVAYEWVHYACHYRNPRSRLGHALRKHHLIHHHKQPKARFGVTSWFWDSVFGTLTALNAPPKGAPPARPQGG